VSERPERSRRRLALAKEICNAEDETNKITQPQNYIARDRARAQSSEKKSNNDPPSDPPSPNPSSSSNSLAPKSGGAGASVPPASPIAPSPPPTPPTPPYPPYPNIPPIARCPNELPIPHAAPCAIIDPNPPAADPPAAPRSRDGGGARVPDRVGAGIVGSSALYVVGRGAPSGVVSSVSVCQ
jgi:hypothetical protein